MKLLVIFMELLFHHLHVQCQNLIDEGMFELEEYRHLFDRSRLDFTIELVKEILLPIINQKINNIENYFPMILPVMDGSFDINWSLPETKLLISIPKNKSDPFEISGINTI